MSRILNYEVEVNDLTSSWIVFIHGAGGAIASWNAQRDLRNKFNLLFIDLRDHGLSKNIKPEFHTYNFDIITDDILETLKYLSIKKASFVTLSFGSVLLQNLILKKPDLIERCVLVGGIFSGTFHLKLFVHTARVLNNFLSFEKMYDIFSRILMPRKSEQVSRRVYKMQARKLTNDEYLKWLGLYSQFFLSLKKYLNSDIQIDTLIVMGENDYMFLPAAKRYAKKHENVSITLIPEAGHICNIDQAQTFNERIIKFLVS